MLPGCFLAVLPSFENSLILLPLGSYHCTIDGPDVVYSGHMHLPTFYTLIIME